jgi:HEAT repeat protein
VPAFISALSSRESDVVDTAANSLGLLGGRAKAAVPALARVLTRDYEQDEGITDYNPRVSAAKALRRIGPQAPAAVPFLAGALKFRRQFRELGFGEGELRTDFATATAAAETLGSFREAASAAVPALVEAVQSSEKDDTYWPVREAAILALGQIGKEANTAVPVLRKLLKDNQPSGHFTPAILVALYQLVPDGKSLAENWLDHHADFGRDMYLTRSGRALLLGTMGRTSTETDWLTQRYMDRLDEQFAHAEPPDDDVPMFMDEWFESLGRCGASARVALPRLSKYLNHRSPFVRLWATEAISKIRSPALEVGNALPGH